MKVCCVIKYLLNINKEQKYDEPMGTVKKQGKKDSSKDQKRQPTINKPPHIQWKSNIQQK